MKLFRTICVLGLALCFATSVYAGTQSVKISGDLAVRGLARGNFDLDSNHQEPIVKGQADAAPAGSLSGLSNNPQIGTSDWQTWFMTTTEVQIDADLTDNVSAVIRLFNQRDWGRSDKNIADDNVLLGRGGYTDLTDEFDVGVDLAYVELKEFLYSPLTLRIGRQDIWIGKGFIVGMNLKDYNANISATEYTAMTSFDAVRATLDYDPWTIDLIAAKIWENEIGSKDDEDLLGVNVGYVFDTYNAETEVYYFLKSDDQIAPTILKEHNVVNTIGLRGSADPIEDWTAAAEFAYQFGDFVGFRNQTEVRTRSAWALDVSAECRYLRNRFAWNPVFGVEYILYSGDDEEYPLANTDNTYGGWDPMYRGKFDTAYREFVGKYNFTRLGWRGGRVTYVNSFPDASYTNQHQALVYGSVMPADSITLDGRLAFFWQQHQTAIPASVLDGGGSATDYQKRKRFMGTELDLQLTWDYTEDVSFGVLTAWFFPGSYYDNEGDSIATDLVGTMKLSF